MSSLMNRPIVTRVSRIDLPTVQPAFDNRRTPASALIHTKIQSAFDAFRKNGSSTRVRRISRTEQMHFHDANSGIVIQMRNLRPTPQNSQLSVAPVNQRRIGLSDNVSGITPRSIESTNIRTQAPGNRCQIKARVCYCLMVSIIVLAVLATSVTIIAFAMTNNSRTNQQTTSIGAPTAALFSTNDMSTIQVSTSKPITTGKIKENGENRITGTPRHCNNLHRNSQLSFTANETNTSPINTTVITSQMTTNATTTANLKGDSTVVSTITSKAATTSFTVPSVSTETTTLLTVPSISSETTTSLSDTSSVITTVTDNTTEETLTSITSSSTASVVLTSSIVSPITVTLESTTGQISATDWDFTVSLQNDNVSEATDSLETRDVWSATILSEINTTLFNPVTMSEMTNMPVAITTAETITVSEYFIDEEITADTLDFTSITDFASSTICMYSNDVLV